MVAQHGKKGVGRHERLEREGEREREREREGGGEREGLKIRTCTELSACKAG